MSATEAKKYLTRLTQQFTLLRILEVVLVSVGCSLLAFGLMRLILPVPLVALLIAIVIFLVVLTLRIRRTEVLKWTPMRVALFLNVRFPELKDSADLLVTTKHSTALEEVQRGRVLSVLENVKPRVKTPHRIPQGLIVLAAGIVALLFLPAAREKVARPTSVMVVDSTSAPVVASLKSVEVTVAPPAYTNVKHYTVSGADFKVPGGSRVTWQVQFRGKPIKPAILFSVGDSLALRPGIDSLFKATGRATQPSFYQIRWFDQQGNRHTSDFFHADVREDAPPAIAVIGREQFQVVNPGESLQFDVKVRTSDDYGVKNAHLVATVSKGSGESVKFREVTMTFENAAFPRKNLELTRQLDLAKLGLEPGDELYFYAEAIDNRLPLPNLSRTETFFIALRDTAEAVTVADSGLGIDLMPDYFRSQRQLIIDTEKLLTEQKRIKKQEFNFRSNELGYDQKALRLKYGQFLGMEDEAGIGIVAGPEEAPEEGEEEEDPSKKFGHEHDKENEHNLVEEKKTTQAAGHFHEEGEKGEEEDPMKALVHEHDSEEEATFFDQTVKTKLKAALTLMWDSELHLRMYEPKKSLPYQYRILNLLKEIAQDNRAYVHRTGFDAPPIKEDKRLSGDLNEVVSTTERVSAVSENPFPAIQAALNHVEVLLQQEQPVMTSETRTLMGQAGYEVAAEALKQPGKYLQTLSALRRVSEGTVEEGKLPERLRLIRRDFWKILPETTYDPTRGRRTLHPLDRAVMKQLDKAHE